jgi:hypothetical protein
MQSVHVGFVLIIFLFPSTARCHGQPPAVVPRSQVTPAPLPLHKMAPSHCLPSSPSVSLPLTMPSHLLFDTASPPCSDPFLSQTSSPLHYHLFIPIALSSTDLDIAAVPTQSSNAVLPPGQARHQGEHLRGSWIISDTIVHVGGVLFIVLQVWQVPTAIKCRCGGREERLRGACGREQSTTANRTPSVRIWAVDFL